MDDAAFLADVVRRNAGLSARPLPASLRRAEPGVRRRWKRWLRFGAGHDWRLLRQRMRAEGLRPACLYQPDRVTRQPAWLPVLAELRREAYCLSGRNLDGLLPPDGEALPFAHLLLPCLRVARQLRRGAGTGREEISPAALAGLERALVRRLGEIAGPCLLTLFDEQRKLSPLMLALFREQSGAPRELYAAFVQQQLRTAYRELGERWPVCLRLMAEQVMSWAAICDEFLARFEADAGEIRDLFFAGQAPGPLVAVESTGSDPHGGGRTVLRLEFASGARLIYKPRPVDMELYFNRTLAWMNEAGHGQLPAQRLTRLLARSGYGWMEWVEAQPLEAGKEPLYHRRLGGLMGVLRAMQGLDMHQENLVAAGAYPVLVDVECLLHPSPLPFLEVPQGLMELEQGLPRELLGMGILPFHCPAGSDGRFVDFGAIGRRPDPRGVEMPAFRQINTDWMCLERKPLVRTTHHHPRTQAGWVDGLAQREAMAAGYGAVLNWLLPRRSWLLADPGSPWAGLAGAQGRHLARSTWSYGMLMEAATAPEALEDGVMFDLTFEALYRNMHQLSPAYRAMAPAERQDLRSLDVPRFGFRAGDTRLLDSRGREMGEIHAESPLASMARGLEGLDARQVALEQGFLLRILEPYAPPSGAELPVLSQALGRHSLELPGGRRVWLGLGNQGEGVSVRPLGPGLHDGTAGIALALAAAARVSGCEATRERAVADFSGLFSLLRTAGMPRPGLGYDRGMAGILVAGLHGAALTGSNLLEQELHNLARRWAGELLSPKSLPRNTPTDLLNGLAGLSLAWLRCHRRWPQDGGFLRAAEWCGKQLLCRGLARDGELSWPWGQHGLSGLSHGGSGYALALAALYLATGERPYRDGAFAALAYETRLFVPEWGNWRDLRGFRGHDIAQAREQGCSWCHGAPGIALARAALLQMLGGDLQPEERQGLQKDLEAALATTGRVLAADIGPPLDDLCCGRAGGADILLECGRLLGRSDLLQQGRREALRRAAPGDWRYWFMGRELAGTDLSLFKGLAGQLYLQARLQDPEAISCILLP